MNTVTRSLTPRNVADIPMPAPTPLMAIKPQHVADLNTFLEKRYPRTFESLDVRLRWKCLNRLSRIDRRMAVAYWDGQRLKSLSRGRARLMAYIAGDAS